MNTVSLPPLAKIKILDSFSTYFEYGLWHILNLDANAHMLFIIALIAVYQLTDLKQILILVLVFTAGFITTIILAGTGVFKIDPRLVGLMVPLTILFTAATNIARGKRPAQMFWPYIFAAFFGLIHGLGLSNYLSKVTAVGGDLFTPLLPFCAGSIVGQIGIVVIVLLASIMAFQLFRFKNRDWILVVSGAVVGLALLLIRDSFYWPVTF